MAALTFFLATSSAQKQLLLQFSNIKPVGILHYQGNCFDDLRGGNACLQE